MECIDINKLFHYLLNNESHYLSNNANSYFLIMQTILCICFILIFDINVFLIYIRFNFIVPRILWGINNINCKITGEFDHDKFFEKYLPTTRLFVDVCYPCITSGNIFTLCHISHFKISNLRILST
jgi:hypothetical protein